MAAPTPPAEAQVSDDELPGMWSSADFTGGATDAHPAAAETVAKLIADHVGHGMTEKCEAVAESIVAALSAQPRLHTIEAKSQQPAAPHIRQPAAVDGKVIGGGVVLPRYFLDFLLGQGALEGFWFGDAPITEQGPLWWRSRLRALAQPQGEG